MADVKQALCFLPDSYYSYGIHPWKIQNPEMQFALLTEAAFHPSVVALGEAGLDKNSKTPLPQQIEVFLRQAALAEEFGKPLIVHCVKAWGELLAAKKAINPRMRWIVHGFRGNAVLAGQLVDKGFLLSFGERFNREALEVAWPHSLLTETDESEIGIREVYARIANALEISIDLLALTLRESVKKTFSI